MCMAFKKLYFAKSNFGFFCIAFEHKDVYRTLCGPLVILSWYQDCYKEQHLYLRCQRKNSCPHLDAKFLNRSNHLVTASWSHWSYVIQVYCTHSWNIKPNNPTSALKMYNNWMYKQYTSYSTLASLQRNQCKNITFIINHCKYKVYNELQNFDFCM